MVEGVGDVGLDEAGLVTAIEAPALETVAVEPAAAAHLRHRVRPLYLASGTGALLVEVSEHGRLQYVAADDRQRGWCHFRFRLVDQLERFNKAGALLPGLQDSVAIGVRLGYIHGGD